MLLTAPNEVVGDIYVDLEKRISDPSLTDAERDQIFLTEGKKLVTAAWNKNREALLEGLIEASANETYTRSRQIGKGEEDPVVRYMVWPPGYNGFIHGHSGRTCFELVTEGTLEVTDWEKIDLADGKFQMRMIRIYVATPGDIVEITESNIHSIKALEPSKSLHFYPIDPAKCVCYTHLEGPRDGGTYTAEEMLLDRA